MASNRIRKFRTIEEVGYFLNGGIIGGSVSRAQGAPSNNAPGVQGLVGKTLIFTSPSSATVTFAVSSGSNPDPYTLLYKDIKAQIEAVMTTLHVGTNQDQQLNIVEKTPTSGVAITAAGTANSALGFDGQSATAGKVYSPVEVSNSAPCWVWAECGNDNMHTIYTWE